MNQFGRVLALGIVALFLAPLMPIARSIVAAPSPFYTMTDLGTLPGGFPFEAYDINNAGQVLGTVQGLPDGASATAVIASGGTLLPIAVGPVQTGAYIGKINDAGQASGAVFVGEGSNFSRLGHAFRYSPGRLEDLGTLPGDQISVGFGINAAGWVVGESTALNANNSISNYRAFLWRDGAMLDLGNLGGPGATAKAINARGQVVGSSFTADGRSYPAFLWQDGIMASLGTLGGGNAFPRRINDGGQLAGYSMTAAGDTHPFLWQNGRMEDLGAIGNVRGEAWGLNNAGQVVGRASLGGASGDRAFFYDSRFGGALLDLNTLIPADAGWILEWATGINDAGQIIVRARRNSESRAFLLTPRFSDLSPADPHRDAILALADRGIMLGYGDGRTGSADPVLRAQAAALIARAVGWDAEDWTDTTFSDQGAVDNALWRNVRTLAHYRVALGYEDGTYNPTGTVSHQQVILFIVRALIAKGSWVEQSDTSPYPNLPNVTDREQADRRAIATYVYYAGAIPNRPIGQAWADWDQPATRGWFAQVLWQALQTIPAQTSTRRPWHVACSPINPQKVNWDISSSARA